MHTRFVEHYIYRCSPNSNNLVAISKILLRLKLAERVGCTLTSDKLEGIILVEISSQDGISCSSHWLSGYCVGNPWMITAAPYKY